MLTRRKLLFALLRSLLKDGWRSTEVLKSTSDKHSDESMSFDIGGKFHVIRLVVYKKKAGEA